VVSANEGGITVDHDGVAKIVAAIPIISREFRYLFPVRRRRLHRAALLRATYTHPGGPHSDRAEASGQQCGGPEQLQEVTAVGRQPHDLLLPSVSSPIRYDPAYARLLPTARRASQPGRVDGSDTRMRQFMTWTSSSPVIMIT
jgi:hypothetical protein